MFFLAFGGGGGGGWRSVTVVKWWKSVTGGGRSAQVTTSFYTLEAFAPCMLIKVLIPIVINNKHWNCGDWPSRESWGVVYYSYRNKRYRVLRGARNGVSMKTSLLVVYFYWSTRKGQTIQTVKDVLSDTCKSRMVVFTISSRTTNKRDFWLKYKHTRTSSLR